MFDHPPRTPGPAPDGDATPDPIALDSLALRWQLLVGRDRKPAGVRVELRERGAATRVALSALLEGVVRGFVAEDAAPFPSGLVLLAPGETEVDAALAHWTAPRNVLLEIPVDQLLDDARARILFESRGQGVRQALRLQDTAPTRERLKFFQYLVAPASAARWAGIPVLAVDAQTPAQAEAAFATGAHAVVGWPLDTAPPQDDRELSPSQRAILELVRLVQADAEVRALEKVFESEPLLAYMLLTLANSVAFRRGAPTASLRQAVMSIGYQRLVKWLVLLLAIASKDSRMAPLIFTTIVRGYCMENLYQVAGYGRSDADEAFIVGAFSLLDRITGRPLAGLLGDVGLPAAVGAALVDGGGPYAPYLALVLSMESGQLADHDAAVAGAALDADAANRSLLRALAAADAMLALI